MRWIGQHIWDFISRFRSDVYLEATETGTIASGGNLGLDSNNKIVKATTGSGDLTYNGSTANGLLTYGGSTVVDVESTLTYDPTAAIQLTQTPSLASTYKAYVMDLNTTVTASQTITAFEVDMDKDGVTADGADFNFYGINNDLDDSATNHANGTSILRGVFNSLTHANATGTTAQYGVVNVLTGSDTQYGLKQTLTGATVGTTYGIHQTIDDGGYDLWFRSSADADDYFSLATGAVGATTITTVDDGGEAAHLTFTVDGKITMTPADISGTVFHLDADAGSDNVVDIDAGVLECKATASATFDTPSFTVSNSALSVLNVSDTGNNTQGGILNLRNSRGDNDAQDHDNVGELRFSGNDDGTPSSQIYSIVKGSVADATSGQEAGKLELQVAEYDGTVTTGLKLDGDTDADGEIDVTIGAGAASITTIAGDLDIDGDTITSAGGLKIIPADVSGLALHIDADADSDNEVQIDAGLLDINVTTRSSITSGGSITLYSTESKYHKLYDFNTTTFENQYDSGEYSGKILRYSPGSNNTLTAGQIYYLRTTGAWALGDADAASTATLLLGVGLGGGAQTVGVLTEGFIRVPSTEILNTPGSGAVDGLPLYLSTTDGHFDFTAPSASGDIVRIVGYAIDDHSSDVLVYFNPDKTWIEIA